MESDKARMIPSVPRQPASGLVVLLLAAMLAACGGPRPTPTPPPDEAILHAYPELEARLPSEVDGHSMSTVSVAAPPEQQSPRTLELLRRLSSTPADLQVAVATGADGADIQVGAMRVVGADAVQIVVNFQSVEEADPASTAVYGAATVAGKRLLTRTFESQLTYLYPAEDIMFMLSGETGLVEEALAQLP